MGVRGKTGKKNYVLRRGEGEDSIKGGEVKKLGERGGVTGGKIKAHQREKSRFPECDWGNPNS